MKGEEKNDYMVIIDAAEKSIYVHIITIYSSRIFDALLYKWRITFLGIKSSEMHATEESQFDGQKSLCGIVEQFDNNSLMFFYF